MEQRDYAELANWAADCAERALASFESRHRADERPRRALEASRDWARGEVRAEVVRELARNAERAARESQHPAAVAAARACAEVAYISRGVSHALSAAAYCRVAVASEHPGSSLDAVGAEFRLQQDSLPAQFVHLLTAQE